MTERLLIGGFASSEAQVRQTALRLGEYYDEDVEPMNFRTARTQSRAVFDERKIITHSGGLLAVAHSTPQELLAIAPPVPESQAALMWRGWVMGRKLRQAEESSKGFKDTSHYEAIRHARSNFGALPEISRHNAFTTVSQLAKRGVQTMVVLMDHDGLFDYDADETLEEISDAQTRGVEIRHIAGEHVRFTNETKQVMGDIAVAQTVRTSQSYAPSFFARRLKLTTA